MRSKPLQALLLAAALSFGSTLPSFTEAAPQRSSPPGVKIRSIGTILITVGDMDRSLDFYSRVLTFEKVSDTELAGGDVEHLFGVFGARMRVVRMKLGDEYVELVQFLAPRGRSIPADSRSNDLWFQHIAVIVSDMDRAYQVLRQNKVEHASSGPQRLPDWNKNAGGIKAFYFKDPDEHPVEILEFPEGKGDPKWHRGTDRLFLGIDHTAIAVSDTDTSLKFYRDLLGLRVAGESENYGTEQEHLNNVFGAHLRITALRAPTGPGIELLEYLSPRDGRPFPVDEHANDLVHRETILMTPDVDAAASQLGAARVKFVSSGVVVHHLEKLDFSKAFLVRDPDGHAIEIAAQ
ncbi:MAG: glyoxalase [Verrucomicrobia bacterium]|nr:MAG: glyoxalase [Verrucomicrobiota bacterium]